jgi:multisubunit Na+/H+ antiporter MnhE subunit
MTYGEIFPIWWSMAWRGLLGGFVGGAIAGFIVGFVLALLGHAELVSTWSSIAGMIVSIPISIWAMSAAINKHSLRPAPKAE